MSGVQSTGPARHARLARASATRPTSTERGTGTALYHTRASGLSGSARANGENLAMRTTTPAEPQVPAGLSVARRAGECAGRAPSGRIRLAHLKSLLSEFSRVQEVHLLHTILRHRPAVPHYCIHQVHSNTYNGSNRKESHVQYSPATYNHSSKKENERPQGVGLTSRCTVATTCTLFTMSVPK